MRPLIGARIVVFASSECEFCSAALVWSNVPGAHYESVWTTKLSIELGGSGVSTDLRHWVNEGLMTFFFLVVGLEAKREFDLGELRERRRLTIPALAAIVPAAFDVSVR